MDKRIGPINDILFTKADTLAQSVYYLTKDFPKSELFGLTSQIRRASVSVVLNITEGYARLSKAEYKRFLEISYGSLKEVKYLLYFCHKQSLIDEYKYEQILNIADEIGKLIWSKIKILNNR